MKAMMSRQLVQEKRNLELWQKLRLVNPPIISLILLFGITLGLIDGVTVGML